MKFFLERNSIINLFLISISLILGITISPFLFLSWFAVLLVDDLFYYFLGLSLFDPEIRIKRCYQFGDVFLTNSAGDWRDFSENLYEGNLKKSRRQAQIDKWECYLQYLQLSPGDSLIDIGCGYGDWLNYAKSKGIHVVGVNITPEQAAYARSHYGIDVICTNWKEILKNEDLQKKLFGKFDAVTFLGCIEHFASSSLRFNKKAQDQIYSDMFKLSFKLLKDQSKSKRLLLTCLHQVRDFKSVYEKVLAYLCDKVHSGFYPSGEDGLTKNSPPYFKELNRFDRTEDFRLTSVLDRYHFGAPKFEWNLKKAFFIPLLFFLDPNHLHKWIFFALDGWMRFHFGKNAWDPSYHKERQKNTLIKQLWIVLERND